MKKILLSLVLLFSSASAIELGSFTLSPEIAANLGYAPNNDNDFTYGGLGRVWLGTSHILLAPQVKYDVTGIKKSFENLQVGGLLGIQIPVIDLIIYGGASWSHFYNVGLDDTWAINYGFTIGVPFIPFLTIGIDASYQEPKFPIGGKSTMNRVGVTIGLAF